MELLKQVHLLKWIKGSTETNLKRSGLGQGEVSGVDRHYVKSSAANVVVIMQLYILNTLNHPSRILPESIGLEFLLFYLESLGQLRGERNTFVTQEIERDCVIHERMDSMLKTYSELQCLQFNYKELTTV